MLDQRSTKTGKQPDYTCSNPSCLNDKGYRTGVWLKKGPQTAVTGYAQQQAPKPQPLTERPAALREAGDPMPWEGNPKDEQLVKLYWQCFQEVLETLKREKLVDLFHGEAIAAMIATLYIARSKVL